MKETFDPDYTNKMSSRERAERFVPTEEIPDPSPGPDEILMQKEEEINKPNGSTPEPDEETVDLNDLSRPPSFLKEKWNGNGDTALIQPSIDIPDQANETAEQVVKQVEVKANGKPRIDNYDLVRHESHGKRGRKPTLKNALRSLKTIWK